MSVSHLILHLHSLFLCCNNWADWQQHWVSCGSTATVDNLTLAIPAFDISQAPNLKSLSHQRNLAHPILPALDHTLPQQLWSRVTG